VGTTTGVAPTSPPAGRSAIPRRAILVVAVAAGVVIAGLLGAWVLLAPSSAPAPLSFSEARAEANASIADLAGGGWSLLLGVGVDQPRSQLVSVASAVNATGNSCTLTAVPGYPIPSNVTVPAYSGSLGAGRAPLWLLLFNQSRTGTVLLVGVEGGLAVPFATLGGSTCLSSLGEVQPIPSPFVDSVAADRTAWTDPVSNASAFVGADRSIDSLVMVAGGGSGRAGGGLPSGWLFEYAPCGPFPTGGATSNQTDYLVGVGADGTLIGDLTSTTACPVTSG